MSWDVDQLPLSWRDLYNRRLCAVFQVTGRVEEWLSRDAFVEGGTPAATFAVTDITEVKYKGACKFEFTTDTKLEFQVPSHDFRPIAVAVGGVCV